MNWLIRIGILIALFWFLRWLWFWFWTKGWKRLLQYFIGPIAAESAPRSAERRGTLKRDPVCGMHVDVAVALEESVEGQPHYFCSERCRDAYLKELRTAS